MSFGFEAHVDNNADSIHQKGESFTNGGLEHVYCLQVSPDQRRDMEEAIDRLPEEMGPSIIVQPTRGPVFNASNCHFTDAGIMRLTSGDALNSFFSHPYHHKIAPDVKSACSAQLGFDYLVDARARQR